ncbi:MAG: GAF and ANTAR domain-containing protein [Nocardioidaceae bacterium]
MNSKGRPTDRRYLHGPAADRIESLCSSCVGAVDVDGGGVSIMSTDGTPAMLYATNPESATIEDLQFTLGEGPCVEASKAGMPVLVADLADPAEGVANRWPAFRSEARKAGVRAVFALPIRVGAIALGTLDLYRGSPGAMSGDQLSIALSTTDEVGQCLLALGTENLDGEGPPTYRMVVHQAAGMLMVQMDVSIEEALVRLRATAFGEGTSINDLAADVVGGKRRFHKERG